MRKKIALLLAVVMLIAMPCSAYAEVSTNPSTVINDVLVVNQGLNVYIVEIDSNGSVSGSLRLRKDQMTLDENGNYVFVDGKPVLNPNAPLGYFTTSSSAVTSSGSLTSDYAPDNISRSLPVSFTAPAGGLPATGCYAVVLLDAATGDVHWSAFGFTGDLAMGASTGSVAGMKQGVNYKATNGYTQLKPNDTATHNYVLYTYALDAVPSSLTNGFTLAAFDAAVVGHVIADSAILFKY